MSIMTALTTMTYNAIIQCYPTMTAMPTMNYNDYNAYNMNNDLQCPTLTTIAYNAIIQ